MISAYPYIKNNIPFSSAKKTKLVDKKPDNHNFKTLFATMSQPVVLIDNKGVVIDCNPFFLKLYDLQTIDILAKNYFKVLYENKHEIPFSSVQDIADNGNYKTTIKHSVNHSLTSQIFQWNVSNLNNTLDGQILIIGFEITDFINKSIEHVKSLARPVSTPSVNPHILIVEDNPVVMMILENKIKQIGCLYSKATTGEDAIQLIKKNNFNLIFTDIGLPGISGLEFSNQIRAWETENNKAITPIIGLTAHVRNKAFTQCKAAGMNDVFTKPITLETLHQVFNTYVNVPSSL